MHDACRHLRGPLTDEPAAAELAHPGVLSPDRKRPDRRPRLARKQPGSKGVAGRGESTRKGTERNHLSCTI